jgi:hypothetical protein
MALLRSPRNTVIQEVDVRTEVDYDVLALRRSTDHPGVAPLLQRRDALRQRLESLGQQRRDIQTDLARIEASQGSAIAEQGDAWEAPFEWREGKRAIEDMDGQERMIQAGLVELDEAIDSADSVARADIEARLNDLTRPLLEAVVAALATITDANARLHAVCGKSQRLLGVARWQVYDGGLESRLRLMQRTRESLARAAAPEEVGA